MKATSHQLDSRVLIYLFVFIGILLTLAGLAVVYSPATAASADASDNVLVSNIGYGGTLLSSQTDYDYAQAFRTGTNPNGYTLDNLQIVFENATTNVNNVIMNPRIELYRVDSSGEWQPMAAWLDEDRGIPKRSEEFTYTYIAPRGMEKLQPHTTYWITVARSSSMSLSLTKWTNHDATSSTGWSMPGGVWIRGNSFDYSDAEGNDRMRLRLHGTDPNPTYIDFTSYSDRTGWILRCNAAATPHLECRRDENGDIVLYYDEHQSPGRVIHWYNIKDADYDAELEENEGKWRQWIEEVAPSSNIPGEPPLGLFRKYEHSFQLLNMFTYDYEAKNRYDLVLKLHDVDENITTSYKTTLLINDIEETPEWIGWGPIKQTEKDAVGTAGKRDVQMCWDSPWNAGRPPITGYDVRYRIAADPQNDWTSLAAVATTPCLDTDGDPVQLNFNDIDGVTTISYTLTDLEPNTDYEVDVRAYNAQIVGPWTRDWRRFNTEGSTATRTAPAPLTAPEPEPGPPALTAEFRGIPNGHNGSDTFSVELHFSEDVPDLSYRAVRDSMLTVTNAQITRAKRITQGSNQGWSVSARPTVSGRVTLLLSETTDCAVAGAVCVDGRKLTGDIIAVIEAQ